MAKLLHLLAIAALAAVATADDCPAKAEFNGCFKNGCISVPVSSGKAKMVCDKCVEPLGYVLRNKGSKLARCDCAPGYAGRSSMMICTKCPKEAQLAPGGPKATSTCGACPPGTLAVQEAQDCMCPAGFYRVLAKQVQSADKKITYKGVACKPCIARTAYTSDVNRARSCATCPVPLVANTDHKSCVDMDDPDAAPLAAAGASKLVAGIRSPLQSNTDSNVPNPNGPLADMVNKMQSQFEDFKANIQAKLPGGSAEPADDVDWTGSSL